MHLVRKIITVALLLPVFASAQKLPQTQDTGVWAPANLKIGDLPAELNGFRAYNNATGIFYTVANDDKNLYLAVKATDPVIINKIAGCGITLMINKMEFTFPAYDSENRTIFAIMANSPRAKSAKIDTFVAARNALMTSQQKIIRITNNNKDEDISVYNDNGIKAAARLSADLAYSQELVVPLSYLGIKGNDKFDYQIEVNGRIPKNAKVVHPRADIIAYELNGITYQVGHTTPEDLTLAYPTNFRAVYTLAVK